MSADFSLLKDKVIKSLNQQIGPSVGGPIGAQFDTQSVLAINPKNAIDLIIKTMSIVDAAYKSSITGQSKKQLVLNLIYDIIDTSGTSIENKNYIIHLINNVFDPLVENIIDITKGKTDINKKTNCIVNLFNKCINKNAVL